MTSPYFTKGARCVKRLRQSVRYEASGAAQAPNNWRQQLDNVLAMRSSRDAAVDRIGCKALADATAEPRIFRYQVLLALMLSSQTRDEVVAAAMTRLKEHGCQPARMLQLSEAQVGQLIYPVGFWKTKARHILAATRQLLQRAADSDGSSSSISSSWDVPDSISGLCALPGVGPKMAYLVMTCGWNRVLGIGVDTHVHRISGRLGWTQASRGPEDTRRQLEAWLPRDLWSDINLLLVGFGQQLCSPVRPQCQRCLNKNCCPASTAKSDVRVENGMTAS